VAWSCAHVARYSLHGASPFGGHTSSNDGNGWTERLLVNLILIRGGYPPVAVRPEDRLAYLRALQQSQAGHEDEDFKHLLYERLDATMDEYLSALRAELPPA